MSNVDFSHDDAKPALSLRKVSVRYQGSRGGPAVHALTDVTLAVQPDEKVAIVGRSGVGKSTIARLASGLTRPTSGSVSVLGTNLGQVSKSELRQLRQQMHLVFQDPYQSLHPSWRARDIVAEPLEIAGTDAQTESRIVEALSKVGLAPSDAFADRTPSTLSGGQRQRVAIARALVAEPRLILADEPTSMLDASLRATIANLLLELQADHNAALIFITHDLALARQVADRIVVLANGTIVEDRPTEELLGNPSHVETQRLLAAARHQPIT